MKNTVLGPNLLDGGKRGVRRNDPEGHNVSLFPSSTKSRLTEPEPETGPVVVSTEGGRTPELVWGKGGS